MHKATDCKFLWQYFRRRLS